MESESLFLKLLLDCIQRKLQLKSKKSLQVRLLQYSSPLMMMLMMMNYSTDVTTNDTDQDGSDNGDESEDTGNNSSIDKICGLVDDECSDNDGDGRNDNNNADDDGTIDNDAVDRSMLLIGVRIVATTVKIILELKFLMLKMVVMMMMIIILGMV